MAEGAPPKARPSYIPGRDFRCGARWCVILGTGQPTKRAGETPVINCGKFQRTL